MFGALRALTSSSCGGPRVASLHSALWIGGLDFLGLFTPLDFLFALFNFLFAPLYFLTIFVG